MPLQTLYDVLDIFVRLPYLRNRLRDQRRVE
jgi:hypothetical protein